jgi:hypothetical protein
MIHKSDLEQRAPIRAELDRQTAEWIAKHGQPVCYPPEVSKYGGSATMLRHESYKMVKERMEHE